jgi:DNA polymerase III delta prime subunit
MPTDASESFSDNWAYLKSELRWLDQILMVAVARQRKENHELERVTQSKADRATSAWWKGIIAPEGKVFYDEYRRPSVGSSGGAKATYQQQLEYKIQVSHRHGVLLGLPALRDRLGLTLFEKNLVLMSLAPEINRRYARLYRYLQGDDALVKTDLPTLDLVLRLLCRNDEEWRSARHRLVTASPLVQYQLLQLHPTFDSLLNCPLKLMASLVDYLLAAQPTQETLEQLLRLPTVATPPSPPSPPSPLSSTTQLIEFLPSQAAAQVPAQTPSLDGSQLVLPAALLRSLQGLAQRQQSYAKAEARWGVASVKIGTRPGTIALFAGTTGTGKATAAAAIAKALGESLYCVDLAATDPDDYPRWLETIRSAAPAVLLLRAAQVWFGRSALLSAHQQHQFWQLRQREQGPVLTILSTHSLSAMQIQWRQQADQVLMFPKPNASDRVRLWQMAIPPQVPRSPEIDWTTLAQLALNGGEIAAIVQSAILQAASAEAEALEMQHFLDVLSQQGKSLVCKATAIGRLDHQDHQSSPAIAQTQPSFKRQSTTITKPRSTKTTKPSKPAVRQRKATMPDNE